MYSLLLSVYFVSAFNSIRVKSAAHVCLLCTCVYWPSCTVCSYLSTLYLRLIAFGYSLLLLSVYFVSAFNSIRVQSAAPVCLLCTCIWYMAFRYSLLLSVCFVPAFNGLQVQSAAHICLLWHCSECMLRGLWLVCVTGADQWRQSNECSDWSVARVDKRTHCEGCCWVTCVPVQSALWDGSAWNQDLPVVFDQVWALSATWWLPVQTYL